MQGEKSRGESRPAQAVHYISRPPACAMSRTLRPGLAGIWGLSAEARLHLNLEAKHSSGRGRKRKTPASGDAEGEKKEKHFCRGFPGRESNPGRSGESAES